VRSALQGKLEATEAALSAARLALQDRQAAGGSTAMLTSKIMRLEEEIEVIRDRMKTLMQAASNRLEEAA